MKLFNFYISASIHVALSVVSLTVITMIEYGLDIQFILLLFIFLSTIVGYNFVKYTTRIRLRPRQKTTAFQTIKIFTLVCLLALLITSFYTSIEVIFVCIVLGLLNVCYVFPFSKKGLRDLPYLKVVIIAFIWAVVTYFLPLLEDKTTFSTTYYFGFIERFLWIILLMIPFEIRDIKYDMPNLKTMATGLGVLRLKVIGIFTIVILVLWRFLTPYYGVNVFYTSIYVSLILAIVMSKENMPKLYASFWVEALPIFWVLILVMMK